MLSYNLSANYRQPTILKNVKKTFLPHSGIKTSPSPFFSSPLLCVFSWKALLMDMNTMLILNHWLKILRLWRKI